MKDLIRQWVNEAIDEFDKAEMQDPYEFGYWIPDNCYERGMQLLRCIIDALEK